jgi:hypothetical protein
MYGKMQIKLGKDWFMNKYLTIHVFMYTFSQSEKIKNKKVTADRLHVLQQVKFFLIQ